MLLLLPPHLVSYTPILAISSMHPSNKLHTYSIYPILSIYIPFSALASCSCLLLNIFPISAIGLPWSKKFTFKVAKHGAVEIGTYAPRNQEDQYLTHTLSWDHVRLMGRIHAVSLYIFTLLLVNAFAWVHYRFILLPSWRLPFL